MAYTPSSEMTPLLQPASAGPSSKILSETKVYPLIHLIRVDIMAHIDAPLTHDQLLSPESTYTIVRPLTEKYLELQNQATVQFTRDSAQLSISTLSISRATLCEILAIRVLRGWSERSLHLATVLLTPWALFQGASQEVIERAKEEGDDDILTDGGTALEMAIISSSKRFIRSPSCQKVIEGIWTGRIIYSALNAHALIADNYKKKPIQMYNPHKAPLLDHYRLKVPRVRSMLEYINFLVLFTLYVIAIEGLETNRLNGREMCFIIYALAFSLDKLAAIREHGLKVFSSSLVNGFDLVFMLIYAVYLGARTYGFHYHDQAALELGSDWLAIGAVLIFPRLAFVTLANNLMVLSIRSMLTEFFFLMSVGFFCFLGFLYALFTLGQGRFALSQIGWWLLEVYFGLDASGFEHAHTFHPFLGPVLMVSYALLSNTLLLTVLVAILGNTFATINADAGAESMFRKAVSTLEGVKADAVFSYQLPFNLVAVVVMWPMSYILGPRWFHKVNVFMIRVTSLPVLLLIAMYDRQSYREQTMMEQFGDFAERYIGNLPRKLKAAAGFENFGSRRDIETVFEIEREVGDFYRGWDEDALDDQDFQLPPAFDTGNSSSSSSEEETERKSSPSTPKRAGLTPPTSAGSNTLIFANSAPMTSSPSQLEHGVQEGDGGDISGQSQGSPRPRRSSMPSAQRSPVIDIRQPPPLPRPRRNSSIHGPSPLAQLFVARSPETDRGLHGRRNSLAGIALSSSHPALSSVLGPNRRPRSHSKSNSQPPTLEEIAALPGGSRGTPPHLQGRRQQTQLPKPAFKPIIESRQASFSNLMDQPDKVPAPAPTTPNTVNNAREGSEAAQPQDASEKKETKKPGEGISSAPSTAKSEPKPKTAAPTPTSAMTSTTSSSEGVPFPEARSRPQTPPPTTRSVRFPDASSPLLQPAPSHLHSPGRSSFLRLPSDSGSTSGASGTASRSKSPRPGIVKASQVEAMQLNRPDEERASEENLRERLEVMDQRQRRMEELLERLVAGLGQK
ncbi:hypothetical protein I316_05850 [Kwoniella heveanensis BCC8398]|uniref:Receptor-activated Ca2+-permeable cation channel n=1 Tax=Kwoniella heveanensis BCC8398 TaxID=1296120 RepID=A0A1B9GMU2_9TREE|nr:hypothetical protein I316_05850 [Kwoniella heveanensis BCC8398]